MKYALCLRGISYLTRTYRGSDIPFTIDFSLTYKLIKENIIDDLEKKGHQVDVFYDTYDTPKLQEYISYLNPKSVNVKQFDPNVGDGNYAHIAKIWHDVLILALQYQETNNIEYDFFITTRFDFLIFEKVTNLFIPHDAVSAPMKGDDLFTVIPKMLIDPFLNVLQKMFYERIVVHRFMDLLIEQGCKCHLYYYIYKYDKYLRNWPLHRNIRNVFIDDKHPFKEYNIEDLYKSSGDCYIYTYKPCKTYNLVD